MAYNVQIIQVPKGSAESLEERVSNFTGALTAGTPIKTTISDTDSHLLAVIEYGSEVAGAGVAGEAADFSKLYTATFVGSNGDGTTAVVASKTSGVTPAAGDIIRHLVPVTTSTGAVVVAGYTVGITEGAANFDATLVDDTGIKVTQNLDSDLSGVTFFALIEDVS